MWYQSCVVCMTRRRVCWWRRTRSSPWSWRGVWRSPRGYSLIEGTWKRNTATSRYSNNKNENVHRFEIRGGKSFIDYLQIEYCTNTTFDLYIFLFPCASIFLSTVYLFILPLFFLSILLFLLTNTSWFDLSVSSIQSINLAIFLSPNKTPFYPWFYIYLSI